MKQLRVESQLIKLVLNNSLLFSKICLPYRLNKRAERTNARNHNLYVFQVHDDDLSVCDSSRNAILLVYIQFFCGRGSFNILQASASCPHHSSPYSRGQGCMWRFHLMLTKINISCLQNQEKTYKGELDPWASMSFSWELTPCYCSSIGSCSSWWIPVKSESLGVDLSAESVSSSIWKFSFLYFHCLLSQCATTLARGGRRRSQRVELDYI